MSLRMYGIFVIVILSGVLPTEGRKNGVEGSRVVSLAGELPEILRSANLRFAEIWPNERPAQDDSA